MLPWLIICLAVWLIGVVKSGLGSGMGLITVPMTAIALGYTPLGTGATLGLLLPLLLLGDLISVTQYRRIFQFRHVRPLIVPSAIGILVGSAVLFWIHEQKSEQLVSSLMRLEIGCESIFLVSLAWWRQYQGTQEKLLPEPLRSIIAGSFTGVSTTLAHAAGPIVANYLLPLKIERRVFVGTTAVFFAMANATKLPFYAMAHQFSTQNLLISLYLSPLVLLGAVFGFWLLKRLTDQSYFRFVYIGVFVLGWYLVIESAVHFARMYG